MPQSRNVLSGYLIIITAFSFLCLDLSGQEQTPGIHIAENQRPALLYMRRLQKEEQLWIAYRQMGALERKLIASARYIQVAQLNNAVLLVAKRRTIDKHDYLVMDLDSGKINPIEAIASLRCLRSEPALKRAMLIDTSRANQENRLIEISLESLKTISIQTLSEELPRETLLEIGVPFKISPDFRHIAYVTKKGKNKAESASWYELKSLNLKTHETRVLDNSVGVMIFPISGPPFGKPPYEWIDNTHLLYQHMDIENSGEDEEPAFPLTNHGLCIFKIVDIEKGRISECFRRDLRLTDDGGSLEIDSLTGCLILNHELILDYTRKTLIDKNLPFSVKRISARQMTLSSKNENPKTARSVPSTGITEVRSKDRILYRGELNCLDTLLSRSGSNFSYMLRPSQKTTASELHAIFKGDSTPCKVDENQDAWWISPEAWIE